MNIQRFDKNNIVIIKKTGQRRKVMQITGFIRVDRKKWEAEYLCIPFNERSGEFHKQYNKQFSNRFQDSELLKS